MGPDFAIDSSNANELRLSGEFDIHAATALIAALEPYDGTALVVDMSGLTFIDSSGLGALLKSKRNHPALRIANPSATVTRLLEMTGLQHIILDAPRGSDQ